MGAKGVLRWRGKEEVFPIVLREGVGKRTYAGIKGRVTSLLVYYLFSEHSPKLSKAELLDPSIILTKLGMEQSIAKVVK